MREGCGCGHKPPCELCVVPLEPLLSPGRAVSTQVLQGRISCISNAPQSLLQPHVSLCRAHLSKHRGGSGSLGAWAYADGAVVGMDRHALAPQETLLIVGELGTMGHPKQQLSS